jgi:hypothetical protein
MVILYLLFFQFVIHLSGGWIVVPIFMYVLMFLCLLPTRSAGLEPGQYEVYFGEDGAIEEHVACALHQEKPC